MRRPSVPARWEEEFFAVAPAGTGAALDPVDGMVVTSKATSGLRPMLPMPHTGTRIVVRRLRGLS